MGQLLIKKNIISKDQLDNALNEQKVKLVELGKAVKLGEIIVGLGYATEENLIDIINEYYNISVTSLSDNIQQLIKKRRGSFIEKLPAPSIPIWLKLSVATMIIIVITVFAISYVVLGKQREILYQQTLKIGKVSLNNYAYNARIPLLENNILQLNTVINGASNIEGLIYAAILDHNRVIKAHSNFNKIGTDFKKFDNVEEVTQEDGIVYFTSKLISGKRVMHLSKPIVFNDKRLGAVHVGVSIDFIEHEIISERVSIIIMTIIVVLLSTVIAVFFGFRFAGPITKLVVATQEIGKGNYNYKIKMKRNDELGNLAIAFNKMSEDLLRKSFMQESFGKYVGFEVLNMIMANPEDSWLKGRKNEATILFLDVRGFTSYSATKDPEEIVEELNEYFEIVTNIVIDYGGYIDKFIGDAVLAVFGVPIHNRRHIERGIQAAVLIQKELIKTGNVKDNKLLTSVGIGIDSGVVISGNIGTQVKMEYTVIGDSVNIASRLNGLAKSGEIVISRKVLENVEKLVEVEALPPQGIKGVAGKVETFRVRSIVDRQQQPDLI
ncbi:adenylate/guanylate cyclase domain-containing protein [Desulfosarcina sp. BuS5]|uniref:adenylate/guanylate cyclase domain-containing protein n=1 Tax=Desulfosarcina sp. BuS5 TaxID=933262 RepID=UPI0018DC883B|nr:adenylate/guanylate cyclase domain-containing protein [Desulfosarcina sp. BuS5]